MYTQLIATVVCMVTLNIRNAHGHGMMLDPVARSTMWRFGYSTERNYNDNWLFCGGKARLWDTNGGLCGICGDPYDGDHPNEAGGIYATNTIVRTYQQGQMITATIQITANHAGFFEFRICPATNPSIEVTQECLNRTILRRPDGSTRYFLPFNTYRAAISLLLPADLVCDRCVLQWTYIAGNDWGCFDDGRCCLGCGVRQERFINCADIAIQGSNPVEPVTPVQTTPTTTTTTTTPSPIISQPPCTPVGIWNSVNGAQRWCEINCRYCYCPMVICSTSCLSLGPSCPEMMTVVLFSAGLPVAPPAAQEIINTLESEKNKDGGQIEPINNFLS